MAHSAAATPEPEINGGRARENTRERLLRAGRRLFYTHDFNAISVEMIAREAGLTRAAFYLHFASKDALLAAAMISDSHQVDQVFRGFETDPPTPQSIERFIRATVGGSEPNSAPRLFHLAALQSDAARVAFLGNRLRYMSVLAVGFPAFAPPRDRSAKEQRRFARAVLLVIQREQLTVSEKHSASPELLEQMILELRDQMVAFHRAYPGTLARKGDRKPAAPRDPRLAGDQDSDRTAGDPQGGLASGRD